MSHHSNTAGIAGTPKAVPLAVSRPDQSQTASAPTKTVKVLHLINGEHFSGAERVQDLLSMALPQFGYEVELGLIKPDRFLDARQGAAPAHCFPMKHRFDLAVARRIVQHVEDQQIRLLHAHTPRTLMIGSAVARRTGLPLVYHVHSPVSRDSKRWLQNKFNTWIENWNLRRTAAMVCVSDNIQEYMLQQGHPSEKLTTVPNGVQVVDPTPDRHPPQTRWTLGTVALFRPRKGTEVLIEALGLLKKSVGADKVRLLAVGPFESDSYEQEIRRLANDHGVTEMIEWTGFTREVNPYFQQMDLFLLPSLFGEGLPMVVLEAMANGVPVIASDVEGIRQAIRDRVDGRVCPPADAAALATAIAEQIEFGATAWSEVRKQAIVRQRTLFSEISMAAGVAKVYDQLLVN